ncbi:hypothetical protein [Stenotrophomonas sp. CFBP 13725]|uniref:hypothetical protein n=1 Tax=Stenotrophomonas sp. CFBP 13725 TaxID=2775297 RepID=UPI00177FC192|nr:hypothetical protein [Stenotrophomonas sp. CFBP 13725]MBD8635536.1 hypothetical protein [Stenotrophomonas sp. CFBP 13725]
MKDFFTRRRVALTLPIFLWYVALSYGIGAYKRGSEAGLISGMLTSRSAFWIGLPLGMIFLNCLVFWFSRFINKVILIILIIAQFPLFAAFFFYSSGGV